MEKGITNKEITERLNAIYQAAAGITGVQNNHMIAMAIMNEAESMAKRLKDGENGAKPGAPESEGA